MDTGTRHGRNVDGDNGLRAAQEIRSHVGANLAAPLLVSPATFAHFSTAPLE